MQPENNQLVPTDYLDQIAPRPVKQPNFIQKQPIIFAVILLVVALMAFMLMAALTPNKTKPLQQLAARLEATEQVTEDASKKIKSNTLRAINSNLKTNLLNIVRDIAAPLAEQKVNVNKLDKKIETSESNVELLATLEDARLNAVYDRTYAREMAYKLSTILNLMEEIDADTNSKSMKSFIDSASKDLENIQEQLADYNSATD